MTAAPAARPRRAGAASAALGAPGLTRGLSPARPEGSAA